MNTKTQFRDCFTDEASAEEEFASIDSALDAYERHLIHLCSEDSDCEFCLVENPNGPSFSLSLP